MRGLGEGVNETVHGCEKVPQLGSNLSDVVQIQGDFVLPNRLRKRHDGPDDARGGLVNGVVGAVEFGGGRRSQFL